MKQRKFDTILRRSLEIPILALSILVLLLLWEIHSIDVSLGRLNHSDQVIGADRELINSNLNMESGVREYLSTGREESLEPYTKAAGGIDAEFSVLNQLVQNQPAQSVQLATILSSFDKWRLLAERLIELRRTGRENGDYEPGAAADALQLVQLMNSIHGQHEAFTLAEARLRAGNAQRALGMSRLTAVTCGLLVIVGGSLMALFTRRQMQILRSDFQASLEVAEQHAESLREKAQLLDLAYDTIFVQTLEGTIRFWNHGAEEMYGYSKQQAIGQDSRTLLRTVFPEPLADIEEKLRRNGSWEGELRRTIQQGTTVTVASRWVTQRDKDGNICGVMEINSDITARKKREEESVEREFLLHLVAEVTDISLAVLSSERSYLYSNPAHSRARGLNPEAILGKQITQVMGSSYEQMSAQLEKAFAGEQVDFEMQIPKYRGTSGQATPAFYAATFKPLIRSGGATRVVAAFIDITHRKRAEEELRISNERFAGIVSMAMDAVITLDASQRIILFNPAAERAFGCSAEAAIGRALNCFIPPQIAEYRPAVKRVFGKPGTQGGTTYSHQMFRDLQTNFGRRADGTKFPLEATISQVTLAGERCYTVILRDIAQRKQAEEDLREKEERFHSMYEHAAVGFAQVALNDAFLMVNPALCSMLGYSETELLAKTPNYFTHIDDRAKEEALLESMLAGKRDFYEIEKRYVHRSGAMVWVNLSASLVRDALNEPLYRVSVVQDITGRKRAEDQLQQTQKMEAIGRLAGGVAHDFNNLLTIILGNSEVVLGGLSGSDPNRAQIQEIQSAGQTAADLTRRLLAFSRKQVIAKQIVDIKEVLSGMKSMLHRLLPEHIDMTVSCSLGSCTVEAQLTQIEQIVLNLVINARDAMPMGGALRIDLRNEEPTDAVHHDMPSEPGAWMMLTVSDSGTGMDAETIEHIFEPFFTTKPVGEGTGLGLTTIYAIVKQCGGAILVSSQPGLGSIFKISLPRSSEPVMAKRSVNFATDVSAGSETILLVDDSGPLRKLMHSSLTQKGYSVLEAADGVEALQISKNCDGPIDLLITDIVMPRMGGTELAEKIMQDRPDTAVVFTTGYADDMYDIPLRGSERITTIQKPFRIDMLLRTVRAVLSEEMLLKKKSDR